MKKTLLWILATLLCLAALGCDMAGSGETEIPTDPSTEATESLPPEESVTNVVLTAQSTAEEILSLKNYLVLETVDASASDCYDAILELFEARPDVNVYWTVRVGEQSFDSTAQSITLRAMDASEVAELLELLQYLPALEEIHATALTDGEAVALLCEGTELPVDWQLALGGNYLNPDTRSLTFTQASEEELALLMRLLPYLPALESVDATQCDSCDALYALYEAGCPVVWTVSGDGWSYPSDTTELDFEGQGLSSEEEIRPILEALPALTNVSLLNCGLKYSQCEQLVLAFPEIKFLWTVEFANYSVRSDCTCFSTLHGYMSTYLDEEDFYPLFTYCTDLVALDIGHNSLRDLSGLTNLKKLKVLIIGDNTTITDISPLAELTELEYLEMFMCWNVTDFTALNSLTKMVDLNLGHCYHLSSLEFMDYMPNLEHLWLTWLEYYMDRSIVNAAKEAYPDVVFDFASGFYSSTANGWRRFERNVEIRRAFTNWKYVESFVSWDDVTYVEGATLTYVGPQDN